jgi:recombination protein RecA
MGKAKDKIQLLQATLASIEKQFGKGAIMHMGDTLPQQEIETISSGSLGVDLALGTGGFPKGRITEIFGPEASGKTTLALQAIAQCQEKGGVCAFIDAEHALDLNYAQKLGVVPDKLLLSQPDCGEQALEICEMLVRSGTIDLIVLDSVAALVPRAEIEGLMGDSHMGLQARLMSQAMRKLTGIANRTGSSLIFINQLRHKIGVTFGNPEVTTGGNALKFYASVRVEVRRIGPIKKGEEVIGNRTRIKIVKNKLAPPFRQLEVEIHYGKGIWKTGDLVEQGLKYEVLSRNGSWLSWGEERLGQGRERVAEKLETEPDKLISLTEAIETAARSERKAA